MRLKILIALAALLSATPVFAQRDPSTPTRVAGPAAESKKGESAGDKAKEEARKERREHRRALNHRHRRKR